jgi:uncharacterized membrane protein
VSGREALSAWTFLVASLAAGIGYAFLFPPLTIADEPSHFARAYAVSGGEWIPERRGSLVGGVIPTSVQRLAGELDAGEQQLLPGWSFEPARLRALAGRPVAPEERRFAAFPTSGQFPAVVYLPQALGIVVGRALGLSVVDLVYAGRLANLLASSLLTFFALRLAPIGRWGLCLLALSPIAVSSRASLSADAVTTAAAFLFIGAVARFAWGDAAPTRSDRAWLASAAVLLCLTKVPYFVLLALLGLVPRERWELPRRARGWILAGALVAGAVVVSCWSATVFGRELRQGGGIDRDRQVHAALAEPLRFGSLVVRHYASWTGRYVAQLAGAQLGWLDVKLPIGAAWLYCASLLSVVLLDTDRRARVAPWQRLLLAATVAVAAVVIAASQYAVWTPFGADTILGIQGRYFLPVAPLVVLLLHRRAEREPPVGRLAAGVGLLHATLTAIAWPMVRMRYFG